MKLRNASPWTRHTPGNEREGWVGFDTSNKAPDGEDLLSVVTIFHSLLACNAGILNTKRRPAQHISA